ncbi:hypothetical protein N9J72_01325 [Candidatus Gracilibacteria bacterium]|nr:hypothetical protein [Candidatus Gracilibacteria bacterium]
MRYNNSAGFSIVIALVLMLLLSFTGLYIIEYTIPYARSVKGIENASQAYFESYSGVENALLDIYSGDVGDEFSQVTTTNVGVDYIVVANGATSPTSGQGTSEYDRDFNSISKNTTAQFLVGKGRLTTGTDRIEIDYKVIDFDGITGAADQDRLKVADGNDEIILWQLSSDNFTLYAREGSLITESEINNASTTNLWMQSGTRGDGTDQTFRNFYNSECIGSQECILKINVIRDIVAQNNTIQPYLQYRLRTTSSIPTRFARITSQGKTFGFSKTLELAVPQQTSNAAFDFTIFQ